MKKYFLLSLVFGFFGGMSLAQSVGDTINALHYNIHLEHVNTNDRTISGFTEITFVTKLAGLTQIPLDLEALEVDSVVINDTRYFFSQAEKTMHILFANPLIMFDTILAKIYYHGQPFHEDWGGYHFSGDYTFNLGVGFVSIPHNLGKTWFPCVDDFTDRATYDVYTTLENDLMATGGGILTETIDNGDGTTTWHWQMVHEIPTYLVSVATGDYHAYYDSYPGLADTIPIEVYTRPADSAKVAGTFVNLHSIMHFFESHFGPYPFEKIGYTSTAIGAMEHAGNIALPHFAFTGGTSYEALYTHELSHMWFGDEVTCSTAEDMWLNEGWATFCELYYKESLYSHESFLTAMRTLQKDVLLKAHVIDGGYWALNNIPQDVTYGKTAYDKGGTVVNALRTYLGDSLFFEATTAYLNHFAYQSVSSEQMRDFFTSYTGIDMSGFFDAWVFTPGTPHFSIDSSKITPSGNEYRVDMYLKQKYKGADFLAQEVVVQVGFMNEHFQFLIDTVHFSGRTGHSVKNLGFHPTAVMMDPFETACDATTDNFKVFSVPQEYTFPDTYFKLYLDEGTDSSMLRVTHHWVAPDSLKMLVEGLRLSPYRYWQTEGFLPEGFKARGRFYYSQGGNLDDGLILSSNDSIVLLYRANPSVDWQIVPQEIVGPWMIGYIFVNDLKLGEYTLAVWDKTLVSVPSNQMKHQNEVLVYPNPAHDLVNFVFPVKGNYKIRITDDSGRQLDQFSCNAQQNSWKPLGYYKGVIVASVFDGEKLITTKKILLL
ncbi:MAG: M1 family aminopeptidase [Bacteroidales bacterium]|nr:M1 family aminopeptidase [Bacteroidales bacterium]